MKYSTNYNMNKPEPNEQYRLEHWNNNTDIIDTELKRNADNITTAETALQNAISEESSRATTAETALQNITDSTFKTALLNFCYPVGSLYWSSDPTNPSELFGGAWVQIKDRFIWAKGDSDTVNTTGGAKMVQLTVNNLPAHSHGFTPSGTVSVTTNPTFTGSAVDTGGMSENSSGYIKFTRYTPILDYASENQVQGSGNLSIGANTYTNLQRPEYNKNTNNERCVYQINSNVAHTHSVTASGSISGGEYSFSGAIGTTSNTGGKQPHENMPPYIVKFCWERTA